MRDLRKLARAFERPDATIRVRFGEIVSVESDRTCTVTVGGSTTEVSGVPYLESVVPQPGVAVMMLTDGVDLLIVGPISAASNSLNPRAYLNNATTISIANNTATVVQWEAVSNDPWGHWTALAAGRLTVQIPGRYIATGQVRWATSATGYRRVTVLLNGATIASQTDTAVSGVNHYQSITTSPMALVAGDYIQLEVLQTSGAALNVLEVTSHVPSFGLIYLG